jgi:CheY-like chemotaxis protein
MRSDEQQNDARVVALIDDEEDVITYFRVALEDHGYRVVATSDPSEALELLESSDPNLVCLDLLMPQRTGMSLYAALRRHPRLKDVPVVILSGLAVRDELPRLLEQAGGLPAPDRFLEKPAEIEQFLAVVDELTAHSGSTQS